MQLPSTCVPTKMNPYNLCGILLNARQGLTLSTTSLVAKNFGIGALISALSLVPCFAQ